MPPADRLQVLDAQHLPNPAGVQHLHQRVGHRLRHQVADLAGGPVDRQDGLAEVQVDAVRDVEEHLALVEARPAVLVRSLQAGIRRVHP